MTKAELIEAIRKDNPDLSKAAIECVVDSAFDNIAKAIKRDKRFIVPGFGTFTVKKRKVRKGRNLQTGEEINIAASKTVGFEPARLQKQFVKLGQKYFKASHK